MPRLSVIIITKNEAANIGACLDSVAFADERIVVDSGSERRYRRHRARRRRARRVRTRLRRLRPPVQLRAVVSARRMGVFASMPTSGSAPRSLPSCNRRCAKERLMPTNCRGCQLSAAARCVIQAGTPDHVLRLSRRGQSAMDRRSSTSRVRSVTGRPPVLASRSTTVRSSASSRRCCRMDRLFHAGRRHADRQRQAAVASSAASAHGLWTFLRTYILSGGLLRRSPRLSAGSR